MRRISPLAVIPAFAVALLAAPPAAHATVPLETIEIVHQGMKAAGPARVLAPANFFAQAQADTLRGCELAVPSGALREVLERARQSAAPFELVIRQTSSQPLSYKLENVKITNYQLGATGGDAHVVLQIQRVRFQPQGEPVRGGAGGITTTTPGVPDRPDPGDPIPPAMALSLRPDLQIRAARQKAGDPNTLEVAVYNNGPGPAGATAVKVFFHNGGAVQTSSGAVPALAAGQTVWVPVALPLPFPAAKKLDARIDDPDKVSETNEGNNGFGVVP